MSRENVEIVRAMHEAFVRGELDLAGASWSVSGEWVPAMAGAVEDKTYIGPAGVRRYFDELFESFAEVELSDVDFRELGERVLVLYRLKVLGRDSGVAVYQPSGAIYELRDGAIVYGRSYLSREETLAAAGLSE